VDTRLNDMDRKIEQLDLKVDRRFDDMDRKMHQRFDDMKETWRAELHRVRNNRRETQASGKAL